MFYNTRRMKVKSWKRNCVILVGAVTMLMLTGCLCGKPVEPVLNGGFLSMEKGQVFTAPKKCVLVDKEKLTELEELVIDLTATINQMNAYDALKPY